MQRLVLIDGNSIMNRAFYGMPDLTNTDGEHTGAIVGFLNIMNKILDEDFEVYADYQKIQQILYNLVSNAIKYSPENDEVEISINSDDENFRILVHDNGIGIDKKYHGKIFAKFVQLDSAYTKKESSTGLGLTITKELVELHEGKISLVSEVNNGSTFIVEIPF